LFIDLGRVVNLFFNSLKSLEAAILADSIFLSAALNGSIKFS